MTEAMGTHMSRCQNAPNLMEKLNSYVEKTGTSKTDVVVSAYAQYLGCAESVPLSQRVAEVERRLAALEAEKRGN